MTTAQQFRWTCYAPHRTVVACIADELARIALVSGQHAATVAAVRGLQAVRGDGPLDVVVRHVAGRTMPWQWEGPLPSDPLIARAVSAAFPTADAAIADAERRGHRVVDVRE